MIKTLKRKFVLIAMLSILLVLVTILGSINIFNYTKVANYADSILEVLEENEGSFETYNFIPGFEEGLFEKKYDIIDIETKYETRYFSVKYEADNNIKVLVDQIAAVNKKEAIEMANEVKSKNKSKGFYDIYRYSVSDDKSLVIFINCKKELLVANGFFTGSLIISSLGVLVCILILLLLAAKVLKPIANSYERQKVFVTDASHELKTPLTIISANNEINEIEYGENEQSKAISKQIDRMNTLIKSMTLLASIDEKSHEITFSNFDLSKTADEICKSFKPLFTSLNKAYEYHIEDNITYKGNENLIAQVLSLIIENASKYSISYTKLNISLQKKKISINIINDAYNINESDLNYCFERFNRSNDVRGKVEGSGIGLSIAKDIVTMHHGKINALGNKENKTFEIQILL